MHYAKVDAAIVRAIRTIVADPERVLTRQQDLASYSYDASFGAYFPEIVVQPLITSEVAGIVRLAYEASIPVYPRGKSTSLSGGPLPVEGGIVLDLSKMNQVLDIVPDDLIAIVSPGVVTGDIHRAAEKYGLMYPPDPSSLSICTIGGNLSENAGGPRGLKYGVTKDYVLGLEVVTPKGEVIRTGGRTVKNVTGYDLTKLIGGSEGTLGIITQAVLQLIPKPPACGTLLAVFDDVVTAGTAISQILVSGLLPAKLEIMDQACIQAVEAYEPCGLPADAAAVLLVEVDGHPLAVKEELKQAASVFRSMGAKQVVIAGSEAESAVLWKARKMVSPAITRIKPTKISEDATVPRSKIPEMFARLKEIGDKYKINLVVFGHAGDGNLHPNILADKRDRDEMQRVELAIAEIFETAVALGGTLSGEHGIGMMKAPFMEMELGKAGLDMMKAVKEAWDPKDIMNPGKIFPRPDQKLVLIER
ncbi:MAG: FAD-linked oxidase C-terminal domain-containing protein [Paenibacillus sp.]|uniref:FAD-binding oxidoreductase n=1 Tax=Paenibacillus sp. TaxID=58172 RepID=UPI002900CAFD|nr:FAD-linked oxidase C-terminal domain-containing protein [Paenibacillus sp.]MDU2240859.1 FAD-linked oxidase C-terminal domain-containing protein [Paenibacillus sp.]